MKMLFFSLTFYAHSKDEERAVDKKIATQFSEGLNYHFFDNLILLSSYRGIMKMIFFIVHKISGNLSVF